MEDELFFKRFPAEKQEQVRQLVAYAQLMGLTGKDLVSIGGKLDRIKQNAERDRNMEIVKSLTIYPIGDDARASGLRREEKLDDRFKMKTATGAYNFERDFSNWRIKSLNTKAVQVVHVDPWKYQLGRTYWARQSRWAAMLAVADGTIQLNF